MSKKLKGKLLGKAGDLLKRGYRKLKAGERNVSERVGAAASRGTRKVTEATRGAGTRTVYRGTGKNKMKTTSVDKMVRRGRGVGAGVAAVAGITAASRKSKAAAAAPASKPQSTTSAAAKKPKVNRFAYKSATAKPNTARAQIRAADKKSKTTVTPRKPKTPASAKKSTAKKPTGYVKSNRSLRRSTRRLPGRTRSR